MMKATRKTAAAMIQDKVVCFSVEFHKYGRQRKADEDLIETDADKKRLHFSKRILESPNYDKIASIQRRAKEFILTIALDFPLRTGMVAVPIELVQRFTDGLTNYDESCEPYIDALIKELPLLKAADKRQLKSQYNEKDYPTEDDLYDAFYIDWTPFDLAIPDKRKLDAEIYAQAVVGNNEIWETTREWAVDFLRETAINLISRFVNQLSNKNKKKGGRIYDATIDQLKDFIRDFPARNISGDSKLESFMVRVQQLVDNVNADMLRDNAYLRQQLETQLKSTAERIEKLDGVAVTQTSTSGSSGGLLKRPRRNIEF